MADTLRAKQWQERRYLRSWLYRQGLHYIYRHKNDINAIVDKYEDELSLHPYTYKIYLTSSERYEAVKEYIEFNKEYKPEYRRLLKASGISENKMGLILGFKSYVTWIKSENRPRIIKAIITLHKATNNNPAFNPIK